MTSNLQSNARAQATAHIWFFFAAAVAASDACRLGFTILTRTMASGAGLGVESYDRLFPSQDLLPSGGFENLIALPLQLQARKVGNTEFLNDELKPHQDQWSYLASVPRIAPDLLGELIARSEENGALAVRSASEDSGVPWRTLRERLGGEPMPEAVAATLGDRLLIAQGFLPRWRTPSNASRRSRIRCSLSSSGCGCRWHARPG